ncbi:hypothetical protein DNTS_024832 [Danionella cerebrum]|uniref:Inactive dual specificity phosphatase 27 n=1 Tax=Danionella cerebrum TaxID=2873325 RepID=A0A553QS27_9TELE|nr:hypothetical protein DNTS_024832 [Danionella translucida]
MEEVADVCEPHVHTGPWGLSEADDVTGACGASYSPCLTYTRSHHQTRTTKLSDTSSDQRVLKELQMSVQTALALHSLLRVPLMAPVFHCPEPVLERLDEASDIGEDWVGLTYAAVAGPVEELLRQYRSASTGRAGAIPSEWGSVWGIIRIHYLMASSVSSEDPEEGRTSVQDVQSHYLRRCPSPSFSMLSDRFSVVSGRFSVISGSESESIFLEPIHLSSSIAAKKIISEELKPHSPRPPSDLPPESAEELMVEDLYNRVKELTDERSLFNTPCVLDIQRALNTHPHTGTLNAVDEVWPNVYIAEKSVAVNKARLKRMGITHILNTAHGTGVYTGELFYQGMNVSYMGIEIDDFPDADISCHFRSCAEFLDDALLTHRGKVLVGSMMGLSRSAVLVAVYLMIFQNMSIMEALLEIRKKRAISPNEGFLKQLRQLNETLMEEREEEEDEEDDDETLSQSSVIDTRRIHPDVQESVCGVRAESIMAEEEEDEAGSIMSSVASSAAAAALRARFSSEKGSENNLAAGEHITEAAGLPLPGGDASEEDGDVDQMIREWQKRNEKYQNEDWWEAQLLCDDAESLPDSANHPMARPEDLESVTSDEVRKVKEQVKRRPRREASIAGSSTSSYSSLWKQRLKEIEEQAAERYRLRETKEGDEQASQKKIDDDVESILSDSSSMYNFCKKNKENLSPLERWKIKRIQFGWNKKDVEQTDAETETAAPALEDVNLTAYQTWKLKQQKKYGGEENKEEILEMSRGEDSATVKRRQRREEILERSRKNLEESQSVCGWETESTRSSNITLSEFCAGAFPKSSLSEDDSASLLSGRSSVSARSQASAPQEPPVPVIGPNGEQMVNIASIQNWISNVVNETLMQKQAEMMSMMGTSLSGSSRAGSLFSFGAGGQRVEDDKVSVLSGLTASSVLSQNRPDSVVNSGTKAPNLIGGRAESVLSMAGKSSNLPDWRAASVYSGGGRPRSTISNGRAESVLSYGGASSFSSELTSCKSKISTTSVPLYSLFQDQVNLHKLDTMEKEIKSDMREKMASYEVKKIAEDNKRSTLYKKKKPKQDDEDEVQEQIAFEDLEARPEEKRKPKRDFGRSGILNLPASATSAPSSIDEWLQNVRPPSHKPPPYDRDTIRMSRLSPEEMEENTEFEFPSRRSSVSVDVDEEDERYNFTSSRFPSREHEELLDPELHYQRSTSLAPSTVVRPQRSNASYGDEEKCCSHRENLSMGRQEEQEDEEISAFIAQIKQRARARVAEEMEDDEVLIAWRSQEESRSNPHNKN